MAYESRNGERDWDREIERYRRNRKQIIEKIR